jgi:hypothetical protein
MKKITLGGLYADSGTFNPDTVVFNGSGQLMPHQFPIAGGVLPTWNTVIVQDSVTATGPMTIGRLIVDNADDFGVGTSQAVFNNAGSIIMISDSLMTRNSGVLRQSFGLIQVANGARFEGGNTAGRLTGGTLSVAGPFTTSAGSAVFQASSGHTTQLSGSGAQTVNMANGGWTATDNRFSHLQVVNASVAGITLATDIYVDARFGTPAGTGTVRTLTSSQRRVIAHGLDADGLKWVNTAMLVDQMTAGFLRFDNSDWSATTVDVSGFDYMRINHTGGGSWLLNGFVMPGTSGLSKWLIVDRVTPGSGPLVSVNGTPSFAPGARVSELNGGQICWGC